MLDEKQKMAVLLELHKAIEETATVTVDQLEAKENQLSYPPNCGLSEDELLALRGIVFSPALKTALRKVIADAASYPLFHLFSILDSVADPEYYDEQWLGASLELKTGETHQEEGLLHDAYYEAYWQWRGVRPDPGWKLDVWDR
jgi:hypothetical protein